MSIIESIILGIGIISLITSIATLWLTCTWGKAAEKKHSENDITNLETREYVNRLESNVLKLENSLFELKKRIADLQVETLKVRSEDHDRSIDSIRRDLLDLQVISGTLPSRAGTMLEEVENTAEGLKSLQKSHLETKAIVDRTKEQMEKLAEAYASLHFTGKEIEELRDRIEQIGGGDA